MKEFSLEEYLKNPSKKVVTRDGRKVTRFLCTDAKGDYPIVALLENFIVSEIPISYTKEGEYRIGAKSDENLFFVLEKHEGWVNIYPGPITGVVVYKSEEDAKHGATTDTKVIATLQTESEEYICTKPLT